jgi:ribosomal RNA-processing protein 12
VKGVQDRAAAFQELIEGEEAEECRREAEVVATVSSKLLPSLFKIVDSLHSSQKSSKQNMQIDEDQVDESSDNKIGETFSQVQALTQAIASLARMAPQALLQTLFKKVIQRLLEASQQEEDMSDKICSLLSLSQALVISQSLDETSVSLLYRSLKPLIRTDETRPRVQKRAYKAMAEICKRYHSFAIEGDRLKELCELLTSSIITSQISARHMRLKCLNNIVDGFDSSNKAHMVREIHSAYWMSECCAFETDMCIAFFFLKETISKMVGEVLLCLKDSNAKTREAAYQLLLSMAKIQDDIPGFFRLVAAALGAETTQMRSAAVMAMSRLIFEFARDDPALQSILPSLLQTVVVLFDDTSREVIKSVVGFVRVCVAAMTPSQLEPLLPEVVNGLLKYHRGKDRFRAKIKIILKKLVKLYGFDRLMPLVPESDTRVLTHMRKLSERDARRKARNQDQKQQDSGDFDELIGSDEEDSDDGRTLMTGATGFSQMTGRTGKSMLSRTSKSRSGRSTAESTTMSRKSKGEASIRIKNDVNGEVLNVADLSAKSVRFAEDEPNDDESDDGAMEFDGSGKLIVKDDFLEENLEQNGGSTEDDVMMAGSKKRRASKFETAKLGTEESKKKKNGKGNASKLGSAYKSKKAGGDVKRKGQKYEPYAYVPLDGKRYTKKNRREAVEQMSTVVRKGSKRQKR